MKSLKTYEKLIFGHISSIAPTHIKGFIILQVFYSESSYDFYERGILSIPGHWQEVRDINGAYIVES